MINHFGLVFGIINIFKHYLKIILLSLALSGNFNFHRMLHYVYTFWTYSHSYKNFSLWHVLEVQLPHVYIFELPSSCMHNTFHSYKDQPSETLIEESNLRYTSRWITYTTIFVGQTEIDFLCKGCDSMLQALCKDSYVMNPYVQLLDAFFVILNNMKSLHEDHCGTEFPTPSIPRWICS